MRVTKAPQSAGVGPTWRGGGFSCLQGVHLLHLLPTVTPVRPNLPETHCIVPAVFVLTPCWFCVLYFSVDELVLGLCPPMNQLTLRLNASWSRRDLGGVTREPLPG